MSFNINPDVAKLLDQHSNATNSLLQDQSIDSMERLPSGARTNSARGDAAGLNEAQSMALRNLNDAISIAQTAEGALDEITNILQRMGDLSQQSANASTSKARRVEIQEEITALKDELKHVAETTAFGGRLLLDGSFGTRSIHIGADNVEEIQLTLNDMRPENAMMRVNVDSLDVTSVAGSLESLASIDAAQTYVNSQRAELITFQNRCQHAISNLINIIDNAGASSSRIPDSDFTAEGTGSSMSNMLLQAESSVRVEANQNPNEALNLLN